MPKILLLLLLCTSCSALTDNVVGMGQFSHSDNFLARFPANKKAIVVMQYAADKYRDPLFWCKVDNVKEDISSIDGCRKIRGSDAYEILMFEPGIYKMAKYNSRKDEYIFGKSEKIFSGKKSLSFEVAAQEVVYVGLFKRKGSGHLVSDEFEVIQRSIESKNYQELVHLFSNSLKEIELFVDRYAEFPHPMVKRLAFVKGKQKKDVKKKAKAKTRSSVKKCSKRAVRILKRREERIHFDRDKYSRRYLKELVEDLKFDKERCGLQ